MKLQPAYLTWLSFHLLKIVLPLNENDGYSTACTIARLLRCLVLAGCATSRCTLSSAANFFGFFSFFFEILALAFSLSELQLCFAQRLEKSLFLF